MGYRSQVRIVMDKEDYEDLLKKYYKSTKRVDLFYKKHEQDKGIECDFIYQERNNGKIVLFGWDWIKWQGEDCGFIENFVYELGDYDKKNKPCQMVVMGEDGASEEYIADIIYGEGLEDEYDIVHADYGIYVDEDLELNVLDKLKMLEKEILHSRFKNTEDLGKHMSEFLGIDTPVKLFLDNKSDFEDEKYDYNYDGEIKNNGELLADVYIGVLYDRQKQLYITEVSFERV